MSLGRCQAPRGINACPVNWTPTAAAGSRTGITCSPCLGNDRCPSTLPATSGGSSTGAPVNRNKPSGSSTPLTRRTSQPTINGNSVVGVCPPLWSVLDQGSCLAPVTVRKCPTGNWRVELIATSTSGVICARVAPCPSNWIRKPGGQCTAPRGVTKCPLKWRTTSTSSSSQGVTCLAPLPLVNRSRAPVSAPVIPGSLVVGMCPPNWPALTRSNGNFGGCQAPKGTTTCPTGNFEMVAPALQNSGVVCAKVPPCPTQPSNWVRLTLGRCVAPRGVVNCPPYWQATMLATGTVGVTCLAPLNALDPTLQPTRSPISPVIMK